MDFGVHLPIIGFGDTFGRDDVSAVAGAARRLGYSALAANDHLVFRRPWLDGPTALAGAVEVSGELDLVTTVALPVVRGPLPLAQALAAIDILSGGRVVAGVGPGSSAVDYEAVGVDFRERWPRFDEAVRALRVLLGRETEPFVGSYYRAEGSVAPPPVRTGGVPIWLGSWGSEVGIRRVARLADGWLASAYNTTPSAFADARRSLGEALARAGRAPERFPNALATTFLHLSDDPAECRRVLDEVAAALGREPEAIAPRLLVGPPDAAATLLRAYREAGLERVFVWPVRDHVIQLERFAEEVAPDLIEVVA